MLQTCLKRTFNRAWRNVSGEEAKHNRTYGWLQKKRELSEKVLLDFIKFL
jgi:hypothetical protein